MHDCSSFLKQNFPSRNDLYDLNNTTRGLLCKCLVMGKRLAVFNESLTPALRAQRLANQMFWQEKLNLEKPQTFSNFLFYHNNSNRVLWVKVLIYSSRQRVYSHINCGFTIHCSNKNACFAHFPPLTINSKRKKTFQCYFYVLSSAPNTMPGK